MLPLTTGKMEPGQGPLGKRCRLEAGQNRGPLTSRANGCHLASAAPDGFVPKIYYVSRDRIHFGILSRSVPGADLRSWRGLFGPARFRSAFAKATPTEVGVNSDIFLSNFERKMVEVAGVEPACPRRSHAASTLIAWF